MKKTDSIFASTDILILIAIIGLLSIVIFSTIRGDPKLDYNIIEIEGMTCIEYNSRHLAALTCNWDKWQSNQEPEYNIIKIEDMTCIEYNDTLTCN